MTLSLLIDLGLAVLLAATLYYGALLNRRLARLREDREVLASVIREFEAATAQAVAGLDGIRTAAEVSGRKLQGAVERARSVCEELEMLVARGERAADRLAGSGREIPPAVMPGPKPLRADPGDRAGLLRALEAMR